MNEQSPDSPWLAMFGGVLVVRLMMVLAIVFLIAFLVVLPIAGDDPADAIASGSWAEGVLGAVYIVSRRVWASCSPSCSASTGRSPRSIRPDRRRRPRDHDHPGADRRRDPGDAPAGRSQVERRDPELLASPAALLGGFSAPAVYGVVSRLVDAVGTLVGGDPRDQTAAEVQEAITRAKLASEQDRRRIAGRAFRVGDEASRVLQIEDRREQARAIQRLRDEITDMLNDLVPEVGTEPHRREEAGVIRRSPAPGVTHRRDQHRARSPIRRANAPYDALRFGHVR